MAENSIWKKWIWFVALWAASVLGLGIVAYLIKLVAV